MELYAKFKKAYKNQRLLSGLRKQLQEHNGPLFLHDTHFARAVPKKTKLLVYDCVDLPLMHQRTSKARRNRHKYLRAFTDCHAQKAVSKADIITMTSPYYKGFLSHWLGKEISPLPLRNFIAQPKNIITPNKQMARTLKEYSEVKFWMVIHNRIGEFLDIDGVLRTLNGLPVTWGLCFLGIMDGKNSKSEIQKRASSLSPSHTVFCHDPIYGIDKLAALKYFDLGLVPLRLESQNLKRCIPNRSLEFLCLEMQQLASRTKPLKDLSLDYPDHIFVPDKQGQIYFEKALKEICTEIEQKIKPPAMSRVPDWSEDFDVFFKMFDGQVSNRKLDKEIIILSENNPQKNNRLFNIQSGLKNEGYSAVVLEIDLQNHQVTRHQ